MGLACRALVVGAAWLVIIETWTELGSGPVDRCVFGARVNPAAICSIRYGNGSIPLSVVTLSKNDHVYMLLASIPKRNTRATVPDPVPDPFQTCSRRSGEICHQVHMHTHAPCK